MPKLLRVPVFLPGYEPVDIVHGIYFIQSSIGYINIGQSENINTRIQHYRTHDPLSSAWIAGYIETDQYKQNELFQHKMWSIFRITGEWYAPVIPLIQYINCFVNYKGIAIESFESEIQTYNELLEYQRRKKYELDFYEYIGKHKED